jgi:GNAT superfamily N-acetyltransferase
MFNQHEIEWANSRLGLHPSLFEDLVFLQKSHAKSQSEYRSSTTAVTRLKHKLKHHCQPARISPWQLLEDVWVWNDAVVCEIERAYWDDVPNSGDWLVMLRKLYVVDSKRNMGFGTSFIQALQGWCEDAGAAVCLIACPFGFSRDEHDRGAFHLESISQVLNLWTTGVFHKQETDVLLRLWYSQRRFRNAYLLDENMFRYKTAYGYEDQFIYVPETLDGSAKQAASHRLSNERLPECLEGN